MKNLKYTPAPWEIEPYTYDDVYFDMCKDIKIRAEAVVANIKLISVAPELFESMLELLLDAMNEYEENLGNFRGGPRVCYAREIELIEKATGYTWDDLMEKDV